MKARQGVATPFSMTVVALLMVLLASLLVFQSQQASTAPADAGTSSMFEPKSGELILDQAPYVGGILGFVFALINRIFGGAFPGGGGPFSGTAIGAGGGPHVTQPNQTQSTGSPGSSSSLSEGSGTGDQAEGLLPAVQQNSDPEPEPEPEPQSLGQQIKCNVFNSLGMAC